jgi:hypothetical protein
VTSNDKKFLEFPLFTTEAREGLFNFTFPHVGFIRNTANLFKVEVEQPPIPLAISRIIITVTPSMLEFPRSRIDAGTQKL